MRLFRKRKSPQSADPKGQDYNTLLNRYNPYYSSLGKEGRDRFLYRLHEFVAARKFSYIDIEPDDTIPVLISAAAVQLTFGLDNYLLDYFDTIYVLKDKYRYGLYTTPFEGHVCEEGIYLSWSAFVKEFSNYSDGNNVGLHEMAHALTYVNFTVKEGRDKTFHDRFSDFSLVAGPI